MTIKLLLSTVLIMASFDAYCSGFDQFPNNDNDEKLTKLQNKSTKQFHKEVKNLYEKNLEEEGSFYLQNYIKEIMDELIQACNTAKANYLITVPDSYYPSSTIRISTYQISLQPFTNNNVAQDPRDLRKKILTLKVLCEKLSGNPIRLIPNGPKDIYDILIALKGNNQ